MADLLMVGVVSCTYRVADTIIKVPRHDEEADITQENLRAAKCEAECYRMLGNHHRIVRCIFNSPVDDFLVLEYYPNGTLHTFLRQHHSRKQRLLWGKQMIEALCHVHDSGIRHSDLRLEQWLVDSNLNVRLGDFNVSGHDAHDVLEINSIEASGHETETHFLPRDPVVDNTVKTDLFALGSCLYELEVGHAPYKDLEPENVTTQFEAGQYPDTTKLDFGPLIQKCWLQQYDCASQILQDVEETCPSAQATGFDQDDATRDNPPSHCASLKVWFHQACTRLTGLLRQPPNAKL